MKRNPTPENRGRRTKGGRKRCVGRFAVSSANCFKAGQIGPTTFSHMNEVRITKAEMWRTAEAIKQAGCRDVLRSEEHTSELQSHSDLVCRLLLETKNIASGATRS